MRTTLSLDPDVAAMLERLRKERDVGLKELVNEALRDALARMSESIPRPRRFRTQSVDLGRCFLPSLDDVSEALAFSEGDAFR
jgi:Ribbon-helix-helix protein, copG family